MKIEIVKALLVVKTHFNKVSRAEFYEKVSKETALLDQIHKTEKYCNKEASTSITTEEMKKKKKQD